MGLDPKRPDSGAIAPKQPPHSCGAHGRLGIGAEGESATNRAAAGQLLAG